jgi:uncharacterized protein Yka (UPF0111/DUF47 family)
MSNFFSKGPDYYALFEKGISITCKAAKVLKKSFGDGKIDKIEIVQLKEVEHEGDKHVHECFNLIADAFITPISSSDMMSLVNAIECITDSINEIGNQIYMMHISESNETVDQMVDLIDESCEGLLVLLTEFKHFQKNMKKIKELTVQINHLEEKGDEVYNEGMRALFHPGKEIPLIDIVRLQNLYITLEKALDRCEDVADIVEQIIISNT